MGAQVSHPVLVESVRPGLHCARWRMADSVREFRHYANTFRLGAHGRTKRPRTYSITATWIDAKYSVVVEAGPVVVSMPPPELVPPKKSIPETTTFESDVFERDIEDMDDLPYSVWLSYGGGKNQTMHETFLGSWRIDDFQFNTSVGQPPFFARFPYSRPWAGCGLTFRLWLDFQPRGKSQKNALKQFGDLLASREHCDVTFDVRGEKMGAHLAVIAARSPVMAAMFRHGMLESRTRLVSIQDVEPLVFRELLEFLYCGRAHRLRLSEEFAQSLLLAADKYAVDDLRDECLAVLRANISLDTAIDTLFWAHANSVDSLAEAAIDYITQHSHEMSGDTSSFQLMTKSCPEVCMLIASKESNKESSAVMTL